MTAAPASPLRKILRDCVFFLLVAAIPAALAGWLHPKRPDWNWSKPGVSEVNPDEVTHWATPVLWVDARTEKSYELRHVPGAVWLSEDEWERHLPDFLAAWQPTGRVIVYCDSQACDASQAVALRLQRELKLTNVYVLQGGWAAWLKNHP